MCNITRNGAKMPKKTTIVSAISLVLLIGLIALAATLSRKNSSTGLNKVSIYDKKAGIIYTPSYEELLGSCVEGLLIPETNYDGEALIAVAVAENTRIRYFLDIQNGFDYLGADLTVSELIPYSPVDISEEVKTAVKKALKYSLTYQNEYFNAPICKISSGCTNECPPYSPSINLPCDTGAEGYSGSCALTPEEVRSALDGGNLPYNPIEWLHDPVYDDNGTLLFIYLGEKKIPGETLRTALKLRSATVTAEYSEDKFIFKCKGLGDNRGMSIFAANYLARRGKTAEEILAVFYPSCEISVK